MKKAISIFLSAAILFGLTPDLSMTVYANEEGASVQAEENTKTEAVDFSNAKVLTSVDGVLYIDGVKAEELNTSYRLPTGKYKLAGDITTLRYIQINDVSANIILDLNGYTWNMLDAYFISNGTISIYDTSDKEAGKIVSTETVFSLHNIETSVFNLYGGTIETTGTSQAVFAQGNLNLYGGKIKSNGYTILYSMWNNVVINIDNTVLESGEDYEQIKATTNGEDIAVIDVSDYTGDSLSVCAYISGTDEELLENIKIYEGIKNIEEAKKYTINCASNDGNYFLKKTEYDVTTGEKYICIAKNVFTQQPTRDNNYTIAFNNPAATFQWYEVEETILTDENAEGNMPFENGKWIVSQEFAPIFSYEAKAGDMLKVTTNSDIEDVLIDIGFDLICLVQDDKSEIVNIDSDTTLNIEVVGLHAESPVELEFSIIRETVVNGATGKTLQSVEHKLYWCQATVGTNKYYSDIVCCEVVSGTEAYTPSYSASENTIIETCSLCNAEKGRITLNAPTALIYDGNVKEAFIEGNIVGIDASDIVYKKDEEVLNGAPVDAGIYTANITVGEATASVTFEILKAEMEVTANGYEGTYDNASHSIKVTAIEKMH